MTVEKMYRSDGMNKMVSSKLVLATSMAVVGSTFQFGYNTGVINAPQAVIEQFYNETFFSRYGSYIEPSTLNFLWGFSVAIFAVGGMVGSFASRWAAQWFGLKSTLIYNNSLAIVASLLMGLSKTAGSFELLIVGRFIIGLNCGLNMGIAPMYLTEIVPVSMRGVFGTLSQMGIVISLLLSQVLGLEWVLGTETMWPLLLGLTGIFSIYQLSVLPFCPESPRHLLLITNNEEEAQTSLQLLRGKKFDVFKELQEMKQEVDSAQDVKETTIIELFKTSELRRPLLVAMVMQLSQQLSGINAIFYYSTAIFIAAGIPVQYTGLTTVGIGVVNVVMTTVSMLLIERAGRRVLHLTGLAGMCVIASSLVVLLNLYQTPIVSWCSVAAILLFVVFFQAGPGSIPWFITAELFDQTTRPAAVSVAGVVNWLGNFAVALAYPSLEQVIGGYTFIIFAVLLALFWVFTYFKVPETKGKSISDIRKFFIDNDNAKYYSKSTKL